MCFYLPQLLNKFSIRSNSFQKIHFFIYLYKFSFLHFKILSQFLTVLRRCATKITVKSGVKFSIEFIIAFSVELSRALVASSNTSNLAFLYNALATAILCLCPPLNLTPLSYIC